MTRHTADLVVLGGGSGGYAAALRAAELGASVILVESEQLGGTCLHRGCVPTKALLHTAEVADTVRDAARAGVSAALEGIDASAMTAFAQAIVKKKHAGLSSLVSARGIRVVSGAGRLVDGPAIEVDGEVYAGTNVVLATGARSRSLPGLDIGGRILDSELALALDRVPDRVVVLGGGVIGVEFASLWRSLGAEVTIVEAADRLLPGEDAAASTALMRAFRRRGIASLTGRRFAGAVSDADSVTVTLDDGQTLDADTVLVAVGRSARTEAFEDAGVAVEGGTVRTDDLLRTSVPGVWAVGDIVAGPQLAHRGFAQGIFVAETIAGLEPRPVPDQLVPRVTYSHPEVASVGLTEAAAVAAHDAASIATTEFSLAANAKSEILGSSGIAKVVRLVDGPVLGVHLVGDRVGELITEAQLVVGWDAHPEDVAPYIHAHPTQSEALGEAFLALSGKPLHSL